MEDDLHGAAHAGDDGRVIVAVLLLGIGVLAIVSMAFGIGPFD